ncbi:hypothetical protein [Kribbella pittospori]|uniref:hypothetical protein n=1 Tax=Kribbella pittospori TaxID=722689 RepID=UPI0013F42577|nr:hypothetical protein [Kribbella pittospori]
MPIIRVILDSYTQAMLAFMTTSIVVLDLPRKRHSEAPAHIALMPEVHQPEPGWFSPG